MEPQLDGDVIRVKALMEADAKLNAAAVNIVCTVAVAATPKEISARLGSLFGRDVEVVAYEDDERDRITVTGPQDIYEAVGVWKRGKANPLKMWVRAIGPLLVRNGKGKWQRVRADRVADTTSRVRRTLWRSRQSCRATTHTGMTKMSEADRTFCPLRRRRRITLTDWRRRQCGRDATPSQRRGKKTSELTRCCTCC